MKQCSKCKQSKPLTEFSKNKNKTDGHRSECKSCVKEYNQNNKEKIKERNKEHYKNNKEKIKEQKKEHYKKNADKCKKYSQEHYQKNHEKIKEQRKEYNQKNKEYRKEQRKEYLQKNKNRINKQQNQYQKTRRSNDPLYKLTRDMRSLIAISIKNNGYTKQSKTYEILGCTYEEFKAHIEQQFTEGMNWDNHGKWHYDHIKPISHGKTEKEILALNHYLNFQPLWARDNLSKSNNIHWQKCTEKYK